jgi:putative drug exporter of the RND superfamily
MFAILFGLSMDYEVFLVSRIREFWLHTRDAGDAVTQGLAATARVITAAAAIMIAVFSAFVLSSDVFLKALGLGLATAILVDATIIRMVLVPATMQLMGRSAWWLPGWLDRLLPQFHIEAPDDAEELPELPAQRRGERHPVEL